MEKYKILENNDRVSVLTGRERIDDMLVFLSYKKLKKTLDYPNGPAVIKLSERKE